jgi:hypothetical protein
MPYTADIPSYGFVVSGEPNVQKQISPGPGPVYVDGEEVSSPVVVDKSVTVTGSGTVTISAPGEFEVKAHQKGKV